MKADMTLFEEYEIRRAYDDETENWWFSVVDIIKVLTHYNMQIGGFLVKISDCIFENEKLSELKDYLLPKLLSSELSVDNAQAQLENVV